MDRRALLGGMSAAAAAAISAPVALGRTRRRLLQRLRQPIGLQIGVLGAIAARDIVASQPRGYRIAMGSPTVGAGRLDWARILPAAYRAGARHFLVEQEAQLGSLPIDAARAAFGYLSQLRASGDC